MTKRKKDFKRRSTRLDRIERKCDRILSELLIIRQRLNRSSDMDDAIDRLHRASRKMRAQCDREAANSMLNS